MTCSYACWYISCVLNRDCWWAFICKARRSLLKKDLLCCFKFSLVCITMGWILMGADPLLCSNKFSLCWHRFCSFKRDSWCTHRWEMGWSFLWKDLLQCWHWCVFLLACINLCRLRETLVEKDLPQYPQLNSLLTAASLGGITSSVQVSWLLLITVRWSYHKKGLVAQ